jgi:hypothetical protein
VSTMNMAKGQGVRQHENNGKCQPKTNMPLCSIITQQGRRGGKMCASIENGNQGQKERPNEENWISLKADVPEVREKKGGSSEE